MPEIDHEIKVSAAAERVFAALATAEGLRAWHNPGVTGTGSVGSEWHFRFAGRPEFRWRITAADASRHVAWECVQGPGDSVGTRATFDLAPTPDGRTLLSMKHAGWPGTHGNFRKCNTTWGVLLHHLKQYVETGTPNPAFS